MIQAIQQRWAQKNGYHDVLRVSLPLILSLTSTTVMSFTDRLFLGWYSIEAISASLPAFIAFFTFLSFFMGVGEYINVFVAQYTGAGEPRKVGKSIWQGVYFSLGSGVCLGLLYFIAPWLFKLAGHPANIQELEIIYFRILSLGGGIMVLGFTLGGFYSGRGLTRVVMLVNAAGAVVNIPLDYLLINGLRVNGTQIVPEMGIQGAALATVVGWVVVAAMFCALVFQRRNENAFGVLSQWRFHAGEFWRFLKFGLPNGVEFCLDVFAITAFCFLVGRLGELELATSNIVFSLHTIIFLPMVGMHIGVSILTGQAMGRKTPEDVQSVTTSALHLTWAYILVVGAVFIFLPQPLLLMFKTAKYTAAQYAPVLEMGEVLLRLLVLFTFFDGLSLVYIGALKGAGDVHFVMKNAAFCAVFLLTAPCYIGVEYLGAGLYAAWTMLTVYICILGLIYWLRFKKSAWRSISVIHQH